MSFEDDLLKKAIGEPETDGRLYSLEGAPAMTGVMDEAGNIGWVPCEPEIVKDAPKPEPMTGTYQDVSRRARFLNAKQQQAGFNAMVFYPHPVETVGAR